jgi:hypothetical protein
VQTIPIEQSRENMTNEITSRAEVQDINATNTDRKVRMCAAIAGVTYVEIMQQDCSDNYPHC